MSEHTPGPLAVNLGQEDGFFLVGQTDGEGFIIPHPIFRVVRPKNAADTAKTIDALSFVVKACNSYEELLEACKFLQPLAIKHAPQGINAEYWNTAFDKLEKAIHKAEEE